MDLRVIIFFQNKSVVQIILSYIRSVYLFDDVGPYHIETSTLICPANQWTGFYMRGTSVMKELMIVKVNLLNFRTKQRRAKALIDFERHEDDELGFRKHDLITVR